MFLCVKVVATFELFFFFSIHEIIFPLVVFYFIVKMKIEMHVPVKGDSHGIQPSKTSDEELNDTK